MECIEQIIQTTIDSFDIGYCVTVNILTYILIESIQEVSSRKLTTWLKRVVTLVSIIIVGAVYLASGMETKLLFNSAILAPVFWSWIGKPIIKKVKKENEVTE